MENPKTADEIRRWWLKQLDLRTVIFIVGGLVTGFTALTYFWKDSHENWDETKALKAVIIIKADREELKSLRAEFDAKITDLKGGRERQYERINELQKDITDARIQISFLQGQLKTK